MVEPEYCPCLLWFVLLFILHRGQLWLIEQTTPKGNWLRDYSQAIDTASLKGANAATIRILVRIAHSTDSAVMTFLTHVALSRYGFCLSSPMATQPRNLKSPKRDWAFTEQKSTPTIPSVTLMMRKITILGSGLLSVLSRQR